MITTSRESDASPRRPLVPAWALWMAATLLSWGVWGVLLRLAPVSLSAAQCQALSTVGMAPVLVLLAFRAGAGLFPRGPARREALVALLAGGLSCVGNIAFYAAVARAPASVVVPLTAMSPAVAVLLAALVLRERLGPAQGVGAALSLAAIVLFNQTKGDTGDASWLPLALAPLVLWGLTLFLQKVATQTLAGSVAAWWFLAAFVPVGVAILAVEPPAGPLATREWLVVAALGFTLGLGNVTIMAALSSGGRASVIAPLSGLYPLVTVPLAVGLLGERLDAYQIGGVGLALASVWLLAQEPTPTAELAAPTPASLSPEPRTEPR